MKQIGYFDIETSDWTLFVLGGTLLNGSLRFTWHDEVSFIDTLFAKPGIEWRAHNGGKFDFLLVLEHAQRRGYRIKATMRGASVLKAEVYNENGQKVTFVDTYALAPVSLAKFSAAAGKAQKGEYDYEKILPGMDPMSPDGAALKEYLALDLLALRDADEAWRQVIREVGGVEPSLTIGGTAWKSASRYADKCGEDISVPTSIHDYQNARAGYFGGRVEVYRQFVPEAFTCDRNSSYPAALVNQPVPVGHRKWGRTLEGDGTVWATVHVPECLVPPLPLRIGNRLAFPVGRFDGVWTLLELRNAIANHGVRVIRVNRSRTAERTTDALAGWCQRVWNAREERKPWNGLLKLLANSLTGKLAQSPERTGLGYAHVSDVPAGAKQLTPADSHGNVWFSDAKVQVSPCARPEWSAYLTSEARIELLAELSSVGDSAVYCDTDSVFSTKPIDRNKGLGLGQWKDEGEIRNWASYGPKFYRYDRTDGKLVSKVKGQSLSVNGATPETVRESFEALVAGKAFTARAGANSIKQSIRAAGVAAFYTKTSTKGRKPIDGWVGSRLEGRQHTHAPTLSQLVRRFGSKT